MKRDMELMRKILFKIEDEYKPGEGSIENLEVDGYDKNTIAEHCDLLHQQGLIKSYSEFRNIMNQIHDFNIGSLTNEGYDYLELIKNNEIWEKTKQEIQAKRLPDTFEHIAKISGTFIGNVIRELNG